MPVLPCGVRARTHGDQYVTTFGNQVGLKRHRMIRYPLNSGQTGLLHAAKPQSTNDSVPEGLVLADKLRPTRCGSQPVAYLTWNADHWQPVKLV